MASPKYSAILIDLDRVTSAEDVDRLKMMRKRKRKRRLEVETEIICDMVKGG